MAWLIFNETISTKKGKLTSNFAHETFCFVCKAQWIWDSSIFYSIQPKTWNIIVCWFLCFPPNLPELNLKVFCSDVQNNFRFSAGKFREKHRNQQTITFTCQFLAEMNKIWSCFIFIKSCMRYHLFMHHGILKRLHPTNIYTTVVLTMLITYFLK